MSMAKLNESFRNAMTYAAGMEAWVNKQKSYYFFQMTD